MDIKKLGFGSMRLPVIHGDPEMIDLPQLCNMVDRFLEKGFTYFDTSYVYHNGKSETALREALVKRYDRDRFLLADKLPVFAITEPEKVAEIFSEQLERCGVSYFDFYLLHNLNKSNYETQVRSCRMFEFMQEKQSEGKIHQIGFSFHDSAEVLDRILSEHPEVDFVQIVVNYYDWESELIQSRACYEVIRRHGKKVVVMEPVKGGALAALPEPAQKLLAQARPDLSMASWAIRFAAGLDGVLTVLSGMSNQAQAEDNASYMEHFVPLSEGEKELLSQVASTIKSQKAIACTQCGKCNAVCPKDIHISDIIATYNSIMSQPVPTFNAELNYYKNLQSSGHSADQCNACKRCSDVCPLGLDVWNALNEAAKFQEENGF